MFDLLPVAVAVIALAAVVIVLRASFRTAASRARPRPHVLPIGIYRLDGPRLRGLPNRLRYQILGARERPCAVSIRTYADPRECVRDLIADYGLEGWYFRDGETPALLYEAIELENLEKGTARSGGG